MKIIEFGEALLRLTSAFPGMACPSEATMQTWYDAMTRNNVTLPEIMKAVDLITDEVDQVFPAMNLASLILKYAKPKITTSTIEDHLNTARRLFIEPEGKPYEYLHNIDRALCQLAEKAGLFARDLSTEQERWIVKEIARQYLERRENEKRGYQPAQSIHPPSLPNTSGKNAVRQISIDDRPANTCPPERAQRHLQTIISNLSNKKAVSW
jgi:hypothetical protein